jgi:uncharacterized protein (TIGR03000 family)
MSRRFLLSGTAVLAVAWMVLGANAPARAQADILGTGVQPALTYGYSYYNYAGYPWAYARALAQAWQSYYTAYSYYYQYAAAYAGTPAACAPSYYPAARSYYPACNYPCDPPNPVAPVTLAPEQPATDNCAHLRVIVPPEANVWIDGIPMQQCGIDRAFVSPPLTPGKDYTYEVVAHWTSWGQSVDQRRTIGVHANEHTVVNMTRPAPPAAVEAARPAPAPAAAPAEPAR